MTSSIHWDPAQYVRYGDERGRPFLDLLARVDAARGVDVGDPSYVVDLGCGPGPLTLMVAQRWPTATVHGVDSSPDMIEVAQQHAIDGRLDFAVGDIASWRAGQPVDVLVANASLHWVPDHVDLLAGFAATLAPGGVLAFQVPDNFTEPSHTVIRDLRLSPRWHAQLGEGADRTAGVERPQRYLSALVDAGLRADVWQSEYLHVLTGEDAVLEWVKGTALRPVLSRLDGSDRDEFLAECAAGLRAAYPAQPFGTVFPFRRTFAVARRSR